MNYTTVSSPVGPILLLEKSGSLIVACFESDLTRFTELFEDAVQSVSSVLKAATDQLHEYFQGSRRDFQLPLGDPNWKLGTTFENRAWQILRRIEFGKTISYKEQAMWMGQPKAVRAVGRANGKNPLPIFIPCHRVIGSSGDLTGYGGGIEIKRWLLDHEQKVLQGLKSTSLSPNMSHFETSLYK